MVSGGWGRLGLLRADKERVYLLLPRASFSVRHNISLGEAGAGGHGGGVGGWLGGGSRVILHTSSLTY